MILEGIVTTLSVDGGVNISPMGPIVDDQMERIVLRPFQTSTTYANLRRHGEGVFHITDDVELLAQAAIGTPTPLPPLAPAENIIGQIITSACRWYAFRVVSCDDSQQRVAIEAEIVDRGRFRDFCGFNRAKHAVLEAAILATRLHILDRDEIMAQFEQFGKIVKKTGADSEFRAFEFLRAHVEANLPAC